MSVVAGTPTPLNDVWNRIGARLGARFSRLELLVAVLYDRSLSEEESLELVTGASALADRLRRIGLYPAADLIRQIEHAAGDATSEGITAVIGVEMAGLLSDARGMVEGVGSDLQLGAGAEAGAPLDFVQLAVAGPTGETLDELVWVAATQGCSVHLIDPSHPTPDVVVDAALVVEDDAGGTIRTSVEQIHSVSPGCPVVALVEPMTPDQMAHAARFVTTLLELPMRPDDVMDEIRQVCYQQNRTETVGLFGSGAAWLADELQQRSMAATVFSTGHEMIDALQRRQIRAVILPPDPEGLASTALLQMIRVDPRTRSAVTVCVAQSDKERLRAIADGADVVHGPDLNVDELALELRTRLRRRSEVEPMAPADAFTHAVEWTQGAVLIERMLIAAARRSTPVGVALIRVPAEQRDDLADQLCRQFRREDVVTLMNPGHVVVALNGVTRTVFLRRLSEVHQVVGDEFPEIRLAGVEFGPDGRTLAGLLGLAGRCLERSVDEHGPPVVGSDWRPEAELPVHVAVLDPNPELGTLVSGALSQAGLRVDVHPSAQPIIDVIDDTPSGGDRDRRAPLPRVILLDLDQRGLDGIEILRRMRRAGALQQTKVIVTADRLRDGEVDRAFDLGAVDAVLKPFSLPLLVRRVTAVLENA